MAVRPNVLSICTGAGGLDLGLRLARPDARVVCYVEREAFPLAVLATTIQAGLMDDAPIWNDLTTFDGEPWRGVVDWLIGGIPCQPHSSAGLRGGESDPRNLWPDTARIIGECRPSLIFMENVPGIARYYHERIGPELRGLGYDTQEGLFSAEEVGASHIRKRFFLLAHSDGYGQLQPQGQLGEGGRRTGDGGRDVGDSVCGGRQECSPVCQGQPVAGWTGFEDVPDAERKGRQGSTRRELPEFQSAQIRSKVRLRDFRQEFSYPPTPDDLESWSRVLSEVPTIKPSVCRMANGLADWLDVFAARTHRLSTLGNGVVPLVAAHAFLTLSARTSRRRP